MDIKAISSLLFLTNSAGNVYLENYAYAIFFLILSIVSTIHHNNNTDELFLYDQIALYVVIIYGAYYFFNKQDYNSIIYITIIGLFVSCGILYYIGKKTENFCFHPCKEQSDNYHALMHICASIGHHLIVFG